MRELESRNRVKVLSNPAQNGELPNEEELESRMRIKMLSNSGFSGMRESRGLSDYRVQFALWCFSGRGAPSFR